MEFKFNLGLWGEVFVVPNFVTDDYIKIATGDNLKVLLYCLRHAGQGVTAGEISRATGIAPDNVTSSLEFWGQRMETDVPMIQSPKESAETAKKISTLLERDYDFSPKEISDTIKGSEDVDYLFKRCEELYGRPLKHNEQKAMAVIIEDVGINPGVALMLMEYCFSIDKTKPSYIKTVAKNWYAEGINTIADAEKKIKQIKEYAVEINKAKDSESGKLNQENTAPPSFDLDELDKQIMQEYKK